MRFIRVKLTNWKNFTSVDVSLPNRAFLIGPNASGKSNFLDAFRFLHDLAAPGGGLQRACSLRGGVSKIRCLMARRPAGVGVYVELEDNEDRWSYEITFTQETRFPQPLAVVTTEVVKRNGQVIVSRPNVNDSQDSRLLSQTWLEQISVNRDFRPVVDHFNEISYLHLVPQMIRDPGGLLRDQNMPDMYGGNFLERVAKTPPQTRKARLKRIEEVLRIAVPHLRELGFNTDERGIPHLEAIYEHWRANKAGQQDENQFSDGTLRLIGLLWALQEGSGLLLMEEPELSLHKGIVTRLARYIYKAQMRNKKTPRQVFMSTHSVDLLTDPGISAEELLVFLPDEHGTSIKVGIAVEQIKQLMESGLSAAEAALPFTESPQFVQLEFLNP